MESILAILCIVFFAVLTYGLIQGANLNKFHKYDCRTIYIPEDLNLETAYRQVIGKDINSLKKRARELGASKEFIDKFYDDDNSKNVELKMFIIQNSISDEHIYFENIKDELKKEYNGKTMSIDKFHVERRLDTELLKIENTKGLLYKAITLNINLDTFISDIGLKNNELKELLKKPYMTLTNTELIHFKQLLRKYELKIPSNKIKELKQTIKNKMLEKTAGLKGNRHGNMNPVKIIKELQKDAGMDD